MAYLCILLPTILQVCFSLLQMDVIQTWQGMSSCVSLLIQDGYGQFSYLMRLEWILISSSLDFVGWVTCIGFICKTLQSSKPSIFLPLNYHWMSSWCSLARIVHCYPILSQKMTIWDIINFFHPLFSFSLIFFLFACLQYIVAMSYFRQDAHGLCSSVCDLHSQRSMNAIMEVWPSAISFGVKTLSFSDPT